MKWLWLVLLPPLLFCSACCDIIFSGCAHEIDIGFDSDMELNYYICDIDCGSVWLEVPIGKISHRHSHVNKEDGRYIDKLDDLDYFPMDSVVFINSDSTFKMTFVNPNVDGGADRDLKLDAHYWNPDNWDQKDWKDDAYFIIREASFEKYKEPIM